MRLVSLQSGSNGNCLYVESGEVRLLFDAGISGSMAEERLKLSGCSSENLNALFISHDHADHVRGAGVFMRRFGLPVYISERTLAAAKRRAALGKLDHIEHFRPGAAVKIAHVTVYTIPTPHDGADGSVFVVDDGSHRLGICTDLGHVYSELKSLVAHVDGLFIESNYDVDMLINGSYPQAIKKRIHGPRGHISNIDAAELVAQHTNSKLQWLCIGHLSADNNTPALALATHREVLGTSLPIHLASRYEASSVLELGSMEKGAVNRVSPTVRKLETVDLFSRTWW